MAASFSFGSTFYKLNSRRRLSSFFLRKYYSTMCSINTHSRPRALLSTHERTDIFYTRRFSDKPKPERTVSVVISRGPFQWISNKIKLLLVNSYFDPDFDEKTFLEGAKQAACTVSALVSERNFNGLEGLLTDEAIENLRDELSVANNIDTFLITMDDILQTNIHDIGFQYDETVKGRKWLHIMVSYVCRSSEMEEKDLANVTLVRIPLPSITRFSFRKECTPGVEDSWTITQVKNFIQHPTR